MGMLQGKIVGDCFIVIDTFALPVEGTETRVNAQAEAYEYMVDFAHTNKVRGRAQGYIPDTAVQVPCLGGALLARYLRRQLQVMPSCWHQQSFSHYSCELWLRPP